MKRMIAVLVLGLFALATPARAQDDWKPDAGFRSLFNGKDLTGWKLKGSKDDLEGKTETANKRFSVDKGIIWVKPGGGDLYTVEEFDRDFVCKMEFRAGPTADSGVFVRGPQLQIRDFKRRGEHKYLTKFKDDDWNVLVITVKGTEASYTLNDEMLKDKTKAGAKGGIGLQSETGTFEYRRVQIQLDPKEKPKAAATRFGESLVSFEQPDFKTDPGFRGLFNGKDFTGWHYKQTKEKLDGKTESADKRFAVKDGVIVCEEGKGIKDLYTNEEFDQEFVLKLEFRAAAKADSGVYVRGNQLQVRDFIRRNEMKQLKKFKNDDWNLLEITVRNKVATLNGKVLAATDQLSVTTKDGVPTATLNGKAIPVASINVSYGPVAHCLCNGEFMEDMKVPAKGGIGLQAETGKFEFRHVQIKLLSGDAKNAQVEQAAPARAQLTDSGPTFPPRRDDVLRAALTGSLSVAHRDAVEAYFRNLALAKVQAGEPKKRLLLISESKGFPHPVSARQYTILAKDAQPEDFPKMDGLEVALNKEKKLFVKYHGRLNTPLEIKKGDKVLAIVKPCLVETTFMKLAEKTGMFEVICSQNSREEITGDLLKNVDAVFFYTTGELPLSDAQKSDFIGFVKSGKGFGGSHCATDTNYKWKDYGDLIGAYFTTHPWTQKVRVIVEDQKHAATKHLGESFFIDDEIYQYRAAYPRDKGHVLMKLDMDSVKGLGKRTDTDNALAWVHNYGKGRVFYTALGHRPEVWNDPRFQDHVIGGLRFMFGLEK